MTPSTEPNDPNSLAPSTWAWYGLLFALIATGGSLYLSLVEHKDACALCFYERIFAMASLGVLATGVLIAATRKGVLGLLALPGAVGGAAIAAWHVYLEMTGKLECPSGIFGTGTAPQNSLMALSLVLVAVLLDALNGFRTVRYGAQALGGAVVLGILFAFGAILATPPPVVPAKPYEKEIPNVCRKPYVAPAPANAP